VDSMKRKWIHCVLLGNAIIVLSLVIYMIVIREVVGDQSGELVAWLALMLVIVFTLRWISKRDFHKVTPLRFDERELVIMGRAAFYTYLLGGVVLLGIVLFSEFGYIDVVPPIAFMMAGLAMLLSMLVFLAYSKGKAKSGELSFPRFFKTDERDCRVIGQAAIYSYTFTLIFLANITVISGIGLPVIPVNLGCLMALWVLLLTNFGFRWYLNKKGDVVDGGFFP